MRALRISLIIAVVLGGLFVLADRLAVGFVEDEAAGQLRSSENLASAPDVSIKGFPFLTQVLGGKLDDVEVGIKQFEAFTSSTGTDGGDGTDGTDGTGGTDSGTIRIDGLKANMKSVEFSGDYSSATAASAAGSASITYAELLKTVESPEPTEVADDVTAKVIGLSDGGNGKIKVAVEATVYGTRLKDPVYVLSTVTTEGDTVKVQADSIPDFGVDFSESRYREITDFERKVDGLPGGIQLDKVRAAKNGVDITVKGSNVRLAG